MPPLNALLIAMALALAATPSFAACAKPAKADAMVHQARAEVNAYRKAAGLAALSLDGKLTKSAQNHACDMAHMGNYSHVGSNGSGLAHRIKAQGYMFRTANENVGKFGKSNAVDWWYNSPGHRANILSSEIRDVGLGVALGANNRLYWVMVGGAQR